jgi:hypothetical protein
MDAVQLETETERVRRAIESELASRLSELDSARRCVEPEQNLINTISPAKWVTIKAQLKGGDGGELNPGPGGARPKFCSAFSSCALAVNAFGPLVEGQALRFPGIGPLTPPAQFEAQRTAGTRGYKPKLDVVFEPPGEDWIYAESKCVEYLRPYSAAFSSAYLRQADRLLAPRTARVYSELFDDLQQHGGYRLLDVAQLLKHFLAARLAATDSRQVALVYVYWEPLDAGDHPVFALHRSEAERLARELEDERVTLRPINYPALWAAWDGLAAVHTAALRDRYGVTMSQIQGRQR